MSAHLSLCTCMSETTCYLQLTVSLADSQNPGLPPSSTASFLRVNHSISGIVFQEFDSHYTNPYYATSDDGLDGLNVPGMVAVASLLAEVLAERATGERINLMSSVICNSSV